jgi:hypothetical protein
MEDLDIDFMIILRLIFKGTVCENFERIQLSQSRVQRELRLSFEFSRRTVLHGVRGRQISEECTDCCAM